MDKNFFSTTTARTNSDNSISDRIERPGKDSPPREEVFSSLARETRNPIQAIWLALAVIQQRAVHQDEPLGQAIRIIREESEQLNNLVQKYLDFARSASRGAE